MIRKEYTIRALDSIKANKLRAFLSMLGIIIGVASVIIMLALWAGVTSDIVKNFEGFGANVITLRPWWAGQFNVRALSSQSSNLLDESVLDFLMTLDGVKQVSPTVSASRQAIYQATNTQASIVWVLPIYQQFKNITVVDGRFLQESDSENPVLVWVIGYELAKTLFGSQDPIGKDIRLQNTFMTVIGVLNENSQLNNSVLMPLNKVQAKIAWTSYYSAIEIQIDDPSMISQMTPYIESELIKFFRVADPENLPFTVSSLAEIVSSVQQVTSLMTAFLAGIAAISLIVWGIWVMNIMLVSVTERTREIGIRKAVWARKSDILWQFLIESTILSLLGWAIGIGISYLAVRLLSNFISATITTQSILIASASAITIWVVFGILPANKAGSLKPIDALRYE